MGGDGKAVCFIADAFYQITFKGMRLKNERFRLPRYKDMDDALSIRKLDNGWELLVAIADPTAYVAEGSELDQEAANEPNLGEAA